MYICSDKQVNSLVLCVREELSRELSVCNCSEKRVKVLVALYSVMSVLM